MLKQLVRFSMVMAFILATGGCGTTSRMADKPLGLERIQPIPSTQPAGEQQWYDAAQLDIEGRGWCDTPTVYDRLPARAEKIVRPPVWGLARNSAGLYVRFVTDAKCISARWTVTSSSLAMPHMPATGMSGLDLYIRLDGKWHWIANGRPKAASSESKLADNLPEGQHEYVLYLPLYNGTKSLHIGVNPGAAVLKPAANPKKPVVVYGTSIDQGGCASRPGMAWTAIMGRRLERPVINLGFSGNGQMEPEMVDLLAELDPAVYVLNSLHNMQVEWVAERVEPCVLKLRKAHPTTPIILVEATPCEAGRVLPRAREGLDKKNKDLRMVYERLVSQGVRNLHYVPDDRLLGTDGEATVDGVHATDLGFLRMADALEPVLRQAIKGR
jgi:hypothetical protein